MFYGKSSPAQAYHRVSVETGIESASPHQLIALLFEGAMTAVASAKAHMHDGKIGEKGLAISKAIDIIINGLRASLDQNAGGELAERLSMLYTYMADRLFQANLKNDPAVLDEVTGLLSTLHGAWIEIGRKGDAAGSPP